MPPQADGDQVEGVEDETAGGMCDQFGHVEVAVSDSWQGLFQISVKLPHEPHKIQVMVGTWLPGKSSGQTN